MRKEGREGGRAWFVLENVIWRLISPDSQKFWVNWKVHHLRDDTTLDTCLDSLPIQHLLRRRQKMLIECCQVDKLIWHNLTDIAAQQWLRGYPIWATTNWPQLFLMRSRKRGGCHKSKCPPLSETCKTSKPEGYDHRHTQWKFSSLCYG